MSFLNFESIIDNLEFYERDYITYTKCLVRKREVNISGHPEEEVRQCIFYFLIKELQDLLNDRKIKICVEENNLDISICQISEEENFQPNIPPCMIIETKRRDIEITLHKQQLIDYMKQHKCNTGLISNIEDAILLEKDDDGNFSECKLLKTDELILKIKKIQKKHIVNKLNIQYLNNSMNGDIQSFIFLIKEYGRYTTHKIQFKIGEEEIIGYCFNIDKEKRRISYNRCGSGYSKKQSFFGYDEFTKLLSIKY
jgi:hypothetical protein